MYTNIKKFLALVDLMEDLVCLRDPSKVLVRDKDNILVCVNLMEDLVYLRDPSKVLVRNKDNFLVCVIDGSQKFL